MPPFPLGADLQRQGVESVPVVNHRQRLIHSLSARRAAGASFIEGDGDDRPDLLVIDPDHGLCAVEVEPAVTDPTNRAAYRRLNQKIRELSQATPSMAGATIRRLVYFPDVDRPLATAHDARQQSATIAVSKADIADSNWLEVALGLCAATATTPPEALDTQQLAAALGTSFIFESKARKGAHDEGAVQRASRRFVLDQQQQDFATRPIADVAVLTGPPGSGKTLVLAARARWLAQQHPGWHIQVLCYNNALVQYLRSLVRGYGNVSVKAIYKYFEAKGVRIREMGLRAEQDLDRLRRWGIKAEHQALLIDEIQDFTPEWLAYALETVEADSGGVLLAGDSAQSLYRDEDVLQGLHGHRVEQLKLDLPYRCTQQILRVTTALDPSFAVPRIDEAPDGPPVDLIWASTWDDQAAAITWEVQKMITDGERHPSEIGVLVTQRISTVDRLTKAFDQAAVPYLVVDKDGALAFDPRFPGVKVMTVHAAKGHEFSVILLFGLEALPPPEDISKGGLRRGRVGFVGMTRAKDQLLITYSKDNVYLKKLKGLEDDLVQWTWPDDYSLEGQ